MLPSTKIELKVKEFRLALQQLGLSVDVNITCSTCACNDNCEYAWDLYNTDGDCLALK